MSRVQLTCSQDGEDYRDISAVELGDIPPGDRREAVIDRQEVLGFMEDCEGWDSIHNTCCNPQGETVTVTNVERFNLGFGIVVAISSEDWEDWLEGYEVFDE